MNRTKAALIFIFSGFIALGLSSCGQTSKELRKSTSVSDLLLTEAYITDGEFLAAQAICDLFRSKRASFFLENLGNTFKFSTSEISCDGVEKTDEVSAILKDSRAGNLSFVPIKKKLFHERVETHLDGELSSICEIVFRNQKFLNTVDQGNEKVQYSFSQNPLAFTKNSALSENSIIYKMETFSILAKDGLVSKYTSLKSCGSGKTPQKHIQTFIP